MSTAALPSIGEGGTAEVMADTVALGESTGLAGDDGKGDAGGLDANGDVGSTGQSMVLLFVAVPRGLRRCPAFRWLSWVWREWFALLLSSGI